MSNEFDHNDQGVTVNVSEGGSWVMADVPAISEPEMTPEPIKLYPDNQTETAVTMSVSPQGTYVINGIQTLLAFNGQPTPLVTLSPSGTYVINYVDTGIQAIMEPAEPSMALPIQLSVSEQGTWLIDGQETSIPLAETGTAISVSNSSSGTWLINGQDTFVPISELPLIAREGEVSVEAGWSDNTSSYYDVSDSQNSTFEETPFEESWLEESFQHDVSGSQNVAFEEEVPFEEPWSEESFQHDVSNDQDVAFEEGPLEDVWSEEEGANTEHLETQRAVSMASETIRQASPSTNTERVTQPLSAPQVAEPVITASEGYQFLPIKTFMQMATNAKGVSNSGRTSPAPQKSGVVRAPNFIPTTAIASLGLGKGVVLTNPGY